MDGIRDNNDLVLGIIFLLLFAAVGSFLVAFTRRHNQRLREQIALFLCALAIRFAASIVVYEMGLVKVLGDEDSSGWIGGLALSNGWKRQWLDMLSLPEMWAESYEKHHLGFQYLTGVFFFITGTSARMPIAAMNCFLGALTVILAYRTAILLFSRWTAVRAAWIICFFPSMVIWSAQTLKEPVIIFLEALALYACVNLKLSGFSVKHILLCATAIVLLPPFRFYAAYLAGAVAILSLALPRIGARLGKSRYSFKTAMAAVAVAALIAPLAVYSGYLARNEAAFERFSQVKEIEKFKYYVAEGSGSGVEGKYDLNSPLGIMMALGVGGAHLLLAPFPWQLEGASLRMLLTTPELVVWWLLVAVGLIPGLWHICRTRLADAQPMLLFILGLGALYSMMFGNVGLIFRQRAQLLPWLLIIAVVGLERLALRKFLNRWTRHAAPASAKGAGINAAAALSRVSAGISAGAVR